MKPMENIGKQIPVETLDNHKWYYDLHWWDGPLTSVYIDTNNTYLYHWVSCDDTAHRWLVVKIEPSYLFGYLSGNVSIRDLLLSPRDGVAMLLDADGDNYLSLSEISLSDLPDDYLTNEEVYFEKDDWSELEQA
jgi:hypothetical protein